MGEDYYDFLVEQLTNWFHDGQFSAGSRYYLMLQDQGSVDALYAKIQQTKKIPTKPFVRHSGPNLYQTVTLVSDHLQALVVPTGQVGIKCSFLLNLQQQVVMQEGAFKDTLIIYLTCQNIPSIVNNARNLADNGGPFDLDTILFALNEAQGLSHLAPGEKALVSDILNAVMQQEKQDLLPDLARIDHYLQKTSLAPADFIDNDCFYDPILKETQATQADKRIMDNKRLFAEILSIIHSDNPEVRLDNFIYFDNPLDYSKYGQSHNWSDLTYDQVVNARQEFLEQTYSKAQLREDRLEKMNRHFTFWLQQKHYDDTHTQNHSAKEYSILAFLRPNHLSDQAILRLPFNVALDPKDVDFNKSFFFEGKTDMSQLIKVVNRTIIINIEHIDPSQVYYGKIHYGTDANHLPLIFKFAILPFNYKYFITIAPFFSLEVAPNGNYRILLHTDRSSVTFLGANNQAPITIPASEQNLQEFFISRTTRLDFTKQLQQQNRIDFTILALNIYDHLVPLRFCFSHERVMKQNLSNYAIENLRRQSPRGIFFDQDKLIERNKVYYLDINQQRLLNIENQMIKTKRFFGEINENGVFEPLPLELPEDVQASLDQICQFLLDNEMTLSLTTWTKFLKDNVDQLLGQIRQHIHNHETDIAFPEVVRNLFYIGAVKAKHAFFLSPFSPLLLNYRLVYDEMLDQADLNEAIQDQISPAGLLPYLMMNGELYQADTTYFNHWIRFTAKQSNQLKPNYAHIVGQILSTFYYQNTFLFQVDEQQAMVVRFAHIQPDETALKGILEYFKQTILHKTVKLPPLELHFNAPYGDQVFERFFQLKTPEDLAALLHQPLDKSELNDGQWTDLLRLMQHSVRVYYTSETPKQVQYHISFYQPQTQVRLINQLNQYVKPSFALNGLIPNKQTTMIDYTGVQGFGTKDLSRPLPELIEFAGIWNTLALICHHQLSPYIDHNTWAIREAVTQDAETDQIIASSYQTILFSPRDELVAKLQDNPDFELTHYHAVEPLNFDVTSVTRNKKKAGIWREYLAENHIHADQPKLNWVLKYANLFDDFWNNNLEVSRTNMNAALKQMVAYKEISGLLYQKDIVWFPMSVKVLKHYAHDFGLADNDMLLSTGSLTNLGLAKDDLLLIGLDLSMPKNPVMYLLPVLLGHQRFTDLSFSDAIEALEPSFLHDYIMVFFAKIFLSALKQLPEGDITKSQQQTLEGVKDSLFHADFTIGTDLEQFYGHAMRFNPSARNAFRKIETDSTGNTVVQTPSSDIFTYVLESKSHLAQLIQNSEFDFKLNDLLSHKLSQIKPKASPFKHKQPAKVKAAAQTPENVPLSNDNSAPETARALPAKNLNQAATQFYLGKSTTSQMVVNWAYANTELTDKHLLIYGDNSPLKTSFTVQLLKQMAQAKLGSVALILDDQRQRNFSENDFPSINRFNLGQLEIRLDPFDMCRQAMRNHYAEDTIYTLINQIVTLCRGAFELKGSEVEQLNQAIFTGLSTQLDTFKFASLPTYLSDQALLDKLADLIAKDPFTYKKELQWTNLFNGDGRLTVVGCTGLEPHLRQFILDYMLDSLMREVRNSGNTFHPLPIYIDDTSALDLDPKGPLAKILKQGSQYGISMILNSPSYEPKADSIFMRNEFETQVFFAMPEESSLLFAKIMSKTLKEYSNLTQRLTGLDMETYMISGHTLINQQLIPNLVTVKLDIKA